MPLLANVILSTARASYNAGTGVTSAEAAYLSGVSAHAQPIAAHTYSTLPAAALESEYEIEVESGVDIATNDIISSIVLRSDGVTPWPGDVVLSGPGATNVLWRVIFHREAAAMLLPARMLYVQRIRGGGPAHP